MYQLKGKYQLVQQDIVQVCQLLYGLITTSIFTASMY